MLGPIKWILISTVFSISAFSAFGFSSVSQAQMDEPGQKCGLVQTQSHSRYSYCFSESDSPATTVFFHGAGENISTASPMVLTDLVANIRHRRLTAPSVLRISFGSLTFLSGFRDFATGRSDIDEAHEAVLKLLVQFHRDLSQVDLLGVSMGGHNAMQVFTRYPNSFRKLVLACPASTNTSPFVSFENWRAYSDSEGAELYKSFSYKAWMQATFILPIFWNTLSPLNYLEKTYTSGKVKQPVFIAAVSDDGFGFHNVLDRIATAFSAKGHPVLRSLTVTKHCWIEPGQMADFILQ
jgi:pimeloyl-ACP methyl ester carboxylesterase